MPGTKLLTVSKLSVQYGRAVASRDFSLELLTGEAVSILGTNGAGKTSCVEAIVGLLPKSGGRVIFGERDITKDSASTIARLGISLVPQLRELFPNFTVEETLTAAKRAAVGRAPASHDEIYSLFPRLSQRARSLAGNLSGGEQQMLAIGRALITRPRLLILDELSAGLSQGIVATVIASLQDIRRSGLTLIVVEQNLEIAVALTDRCVVMSVGSVVWRGSVKEAVDSDSIRGSFFGEL
jgi:branched-chain amino acid transport system ATP-binding protein